MTYKKLYEQTALEQEPRSGIFACHSCLTNIGRKETLTPLNFTHEPPSGKKRKDTIRIKCRRCAMASNHKKPNVYNNWS